MKFIKSNILPILSIVVYVVVAGLLAVPGFAHFILKGQGEFTYYLNGYQFFFNSYKTVLDAKLGASVVGSGIAIIVLTVVSIALICLWKKSSFFVLLASLTTITNAILFFTMESACAKAYPSMTVYDGVSNCGWVTYFLGAIVILLGLYLGYKAVRMMINEVKHPSAPKGPSYNYLKK